MTDRAIVWRRTDKPGHEFCTLAKTETGVKLTGVAVLSNDGTPCCLQYTIDCDSQWRTQLCRLSGYIGKHGFTLDIRHEGENWLLNGVEVPEVAGSEDIDLGFSPSTNLLPIRRLALEVGGSANVRAAWLRFPELTVEPLEQVYTRLGPDSYRYESGGGAFRRDLKVDERGIVVDYPEIWNAESAI
ncbi:MAG: putative glycolipid-binding domain-containing protein [Gemmatimonadaceae bacterium]